MKTPCSGVAPGVVAALLSCGSLAHTRDLSFEDRVNAQEAIERVYYSHQVGATKSFDEAVPQVVLERKVRTYLRQSAALERFWKTTINAEMLQREEDRIAEGTRMPFRLQELYAAFRGDRALFQECVARETLAGRLVRNFFAGDRALHAPSRAVAEALQRALASGELSLDSPHPFRSVLSVVRAGSGSESPVAAGAARLAVDSGEFERWRAAFHESRAGVTPVLEEREAFAIRGLLAQGDGWIRIAQYGVPKKPLDAWWSDIEETLDDPQLRAVAAPSPRSAAITNLMPGEPGSPRGGGCAPDDTWDPGILDDAPDKRTWHTTVWTGTHMLVWGGSKAENRPLGTGFRYDPLTDTWTGLSTLNAPSPRARHTAVWTGTQMIIWGGQEYVYGGPPNYPSTGARYDPVQDLWTPTSIVNAPAGRSQHSAVWTGTEMVVWGGFDGLSVGNGGRYDPTLDAWEPVSTVGAPSARRDHTAVWAGDAMVVWGGGQAVVGLPDSVLDTGGQYDPVLDSWTPTKTKFAPVARSLHTAVWTGSEMVVWGGRSYSQVFGSGGRYDPRRDRWRDTSAVGAPTPRASHTAVWTGSEMLVWGGSGPNGGDVQDSGGRYDPAAPDGWQATSTTNAPPRRSNHTAVWTGDSMIVWGGVGEPGTGLLDTGGRYDPITDFWTPTALTDAPRERGGHTSVWTGNLVIVWGGSDGPDLDTGGRYDPLLDSWYSMSTAGAPTPRHAHTALWTGYEMLVWGGYGGGTGATATGGRYDPFSDTWAPTSGVGAPAKRFGHTAVWSGSDMIVWGGHDSSYLDSGGRYDPAEDIWAPVSTVGAPTARSGHTAVWTGLRMVVWGGNGSFGQLNTGARYDPVVGTWMSTTQDGAPSRRVEHEAVWTGREMVVWGGGNAFGPTNTGGRYDPFLDAWRATSTTNAPEARSLHAAVWTGTQVLVWGGHGGGVPAPYFSAGGRYDPVADSWMPMATSDAPVGRQDHALVWTGDFAVVWGGYNGGNFRSGSRYSVDTDGDGVSNVCDDDNDNDGVLDVQDCAAGDPTAFAMPGEIQGLTLAPDKTTLTWTSAAPGAGTGTLHDVLRGALAELPVGSGGSETCLASGIPDATASDFSIPAEAQAYWYVVRGRNACGVGTYGSQSSGAPRASPTCP